MEINVDKEDVFFSQQVSKLLYTPWKRLSDKCETCNGKETVEHVLIGRTKFNVERERLKGKVVDTEDKR